MKKILLIIILIFGIISTPIFAAEETVIIDSVATEGVYIGQTFPVGIAIYEAQANTTFFYKFYGGVGNNQNYIQNSELLTNNTSWSSFPTFTTDSNGNAYVDTSAYIKIGSPQSIYDLYVQLAFPDYSTPANYTSFSQPIRVISLFVTPTITPSHTPTPTPIPTFTPSPTSTLAPNTTPTTTPIITNNRLIPTLTPTPTIIPQKFGTIATASALTSIAPSGSISDTTLTDLDSNYIQTGSNPDQEIIEVPKIQKTSGITNLGAKIFFVFLLTSVSFVLYCLCFFGYTIETLLPEINHFLSLIKPQFINIFFILKKSSKKISQYLQSLFISIKSYIKNSKAIKKLFSNFSKLFFVLLNISLNIFQKIIKYCYYIFQKFFTFIKKHIKVPRKIKRYLSHKKFNISILIFLGLVINFFVKPFQLII